MIPAVRDLLGQHFLLKHLAAAELDQLARMAITRLCRPNEAVFLKGDPGNSMMAVVHGRVRICSYSSEGREVILNVINPGEVFGEIALIDGGSRTADAFAMDATELVVLSRRDFLPFLERNPRSASSCWRCCANGCGPPVLRSRTSSFSISARVSPSACSPPPITRPITAQEAIRERFGSPNTCLRA